MQTGSSSSQTSTDCSWLTFTFLQTKVVNEMKKYFIYNRKKIRLLSPLCHLTCFYVICVCGLIALVKHSSKIGWQLLQLPTYLITVRAYFYHKTILTHCQENVKHLTITTIQLEILIIWAQYRCAIGIKFK